MPEIRPPQEFRQTPELRDAREVERIRLGMRFNQEATLENMKSIAHTVTLLYRVCLEHQAPRRDAARLAQQPPPIHVRPGSIFADIAADVAQVSVYGVAAILMIKRVVAEIATMRIDLRRARARSTNALETELRRMNPRSADDLLSASVANLAIEKKKLPKDRESKG